MQTVYVQWADATEAGIISVFSCPQDPNDYPNQAALPSNDSRYEEWYAALPEATKLAGGLVVPGT